MAPLMQCNYACWVQQVDEDKKWRAKEKNNQANLATLTHWGDISLFAMYKYNAWGPKYDGNLLQLGI